MENNTYYRALYLTWLLSSRGEYRIPTDKQIKRWFEEDFQNHLPKEPTARLLHVHQASMGMGIPLRATAAWISSEF